MSNLLSDIREREITEMMEYAEELKRKISSENDPLKREELEDDLRGLQEATESLANFDPELYEEKQAEIERQARDENDFYYLERCW